MKNRKKICLCVGLIAVLLLTGCAHQGSAVTSKDTPSQQQTQTDKTETNKGDTAAESTKGGEEQEKQEEKPSSSADTSPQVDDTLKKKSASAPNTTAEPSEKPEESPAEMPSDEAKQSCVSLSIVGNDTILAEQEVSWNEGDTVIDVLLRETKARNIQMEYSGTKGAAYVIGIDNLYEFDEGQGSGWMYSVNGTYPKTSCGSYTLHKGDIVAWRYTKNQGADLGAKKE